MSGRIPQSFIDDLLQRADIVDYINARVPLKKKGKNYGACCPFHDEKTPSFSVSREKQFYYCFGCQAGGNVIGFAMDYEGLAFPEAIERVAAENGIEVPREKGEDSKRSKLRNSIYDILKESDRFYREQLKNSSEAIDYLKGRGISGTTARDFGIGYAPEGWDNLILKLGKASEEITALDKGGMIIKRENKDGYYDRFRHRLMFPIRDQRGRTIAFGGRIIPQDATKGSANAAGDRKSGAAQPKYLNSPETEVFHKAYELYGLFETHRFAPKTERLIVVEGYMDVVSLYQSGIKGAVATLGTAVTSHHLEKIFRNVAEVVFCFDGDQAGRTAADRALHAALPLMIDGRQARFLFLPEGEDPDTRVQSIGAEAFEQELQKAMPLSNYLFKSVDAGDDLSSPDARAKLHSLVTPLIKTLPKGVFRRLLEQDLADRTGIQNDDSDKPQKRDNPPPMQAVPAANNTSRQRKSRISSAEQLISIALFHPQVTQDQPLPEVLAECDETEAQVLKRIWKLTSEELELNFGGLYARLQGMGGEADRLVNKISGSSMHKSAEIETARKELADILRHWTHRSESFLLQQRLNELKSIPYESLTLELKTEHREILQRIGELKQARHDPS